MSAKAITAALIVLAAASLTTLMPRAAGEGTVSALVAIGPFSSRHIDAVATLDGGPRDAELPIVLLHGLYSRKEAWLPFAYPLTPTRRVLLPGWPRPLSNDPTPRAVARRMIEWANEAGLTRFHVGGSSFGGAVALHMADLAPQRVKTVLLVGSPYGVVPPGTDLSSMSTRERFAAIAPNAARPLKWLASLTSKPSTEEDRALWQALAAAPLDTISLLERVEPPVLLVWCKGDRVFDGKAAKLAARHARQADIHAAHRCGHAPAIEHPQRMRYYVKFFLDHVEQGLWPVWYPPPGDPRFDGERLAPV